MKQQNFNQFLIVFSLLSLIHCTGNDTINYAPPPPINTTTLAILNNSQIGLKFIGSNSFQSLQITQGNNNASQLVTNFKFNALNKTAPNNIKVAELPNILGNWSHLISTKQTLSCSLVFQSTASKYGMILNDWRQNLTNMIFNGTISSFPTQIQNITLQQFQARVHLGANCRVADFDGVFYSFNNLNNTWNLVNRPSNWTTQAMTESFMYGISQGNLFRFNEAANQYTQLAVLKNYQRYELNHMQGKIIVIGFNATTDNNSTFQVNQTIFLFEDKLGQLNNITAFDLTGFSPMMMLPVYISPQLTKIGFLVSPPPMNNSNPNNTNNTNNTNNSNNLRPQFVVKSIDFVNTRVNNFTFKEPQHFMETLRGAKPHQISLGDYSISLRNTTPPQNGSGTPSEQVYQFVGNQILFLRGRGLVGPQITDWISMQVDPFSQNNVIVLNVYNVANGFKINQSQYGSLAANNRIIPQPIPPFVNITLPLFTGQFPSENNFAWTFINARSGPNTDFTIFKINRTSQNKVDSTNFSLTGNWTVLSQSEQCLLLLQTGNNTIKLFKFNPNSHNFDNFADLTATLSNLTLSQTTIWRLSMTGDRFSADRHMFTNQPNNATTYTPISNNLTNFTWTQADKNLTTVIAGNSIWRFNPSQLGFVRYFDNPSPFLPESKLAIWRNRVIVMGTDNTTAHVLAYSDNNSGNLTVCLNYTFNHFVNRPQIQISSNFTKILIMGPFTPPNTTDVKPKFDAFFVDYDRIQNANISFPLDTVKDPRSTFINLDEQFLYIRQLFNASANNTYQNQEFVYFIDQNVVLKLASKTNITNEQAGMWVKSLLQKTPDGKIYQLTQTREGNSTNFIIIRQSEVNANQANLNSNPNQMISGVIVDGKVKLCSPGCSDCSSGTCSQCYPTFSLDSGTATCLTCGPNCKSCSNTNSNQCYSCLKGAYLQGTVCKPCDRSCISCNGTSTTCQSCPPGQFFNVANCSACPKNCFNCSSSTVCITCQHGFSLIAGKCRGCSMSCSGCNPANITECTSCAQGLELSNGKCIQCPDKCAECGNGLCASCIPGYQPNSFGVCVLTCKLPCATCADNQPLTCLSCYSGSILSGSTCQIDLSCNINSTCTDCGQGLNYILVGSTCMSCSSIDHCIQCSQSNSDLCAICSKGYFTNGTSGCGACPIICNSCVSQTICTGCVIGYTLPRDQAQGVCMPCVSPCATCIGNPNYCTSCVSGFTKIGWKCQNNTYTGFTLVLATTPQTFLGDIDNFVGNLTALSGNNNTDSSAITFTSIVAGSAVVSGTYTGVSSGTISAALASGGSFGGYSITSSSIVGVGSEMQVKKDNMPMIVGLSVGIPVLIIVFVVVGIIIYKKRKAESVNTEMIQIQNKNQIMIEDSEEIGSGKVALGEHKMKESIQIGNQQFGSVWQKQI